MQVDAPSPADQSYVEHLARAASVTLDFQAELERSWAWLRVVRSEPLGAPFALLLAWFVADEVHIIDVATHPLHRRKGAAKLLLSELIAEARTRKARVVLLEVRASNVAAISLYQGFAFEVANRRKAYYSAPREDALEMMLTLPMLPA